MTPPPELSLETLAIAWGLIFLAALMLAALAPLMIVQTRRSFRNRNRVDGLVGAFITLGTIAMGFGVLWVAGRALTLWP